MKYKLILHKILIQLLIYIYKNAYDFPLKLKLYYQSHQDIILYKIGNVKIIFFFFVTHIMQQYSSQ